ncbi:SMUG2 DNA glycosylase family protein [Sphingobacterium sp.]|uniref:SMUG2 DNA glycosylase family protein n=1 Tax=Sphingobacterium sp. TaxID=341027 RepID=UPI0028995734|nr:SMUG2 DNA glycosylase family protein [Sphingobacterium sp.]
MGKETIGDKIIDFNLNLDYDGPLPPGFQVINPFRDNPETVAVMRAFYRKFYNDNLERSFIIGINPSRHGAAVTGVPFTDTKRLSSVCGIAMSTAHTHEISSVYMYRVIEAYGGPIAFYNDFYINSPFPLALVRRQGNAWVNANYYDDPELLECLEPFMIETLEKHIALGLIKEKIFILGKKNAMFINKLNKKCRLFESLIVLDHPRYIQQYKSKDSEYYIDAYLRALAAH